jgi:hypothetical protein
MHEIDLLFGTDILLSDGRAGKLCGVAVNTETQHITHLLVEDGFLVKKTRAFPFPIAASFDSGITLSISSTAVEDYPVYREENIPVPVEGGGTAWSSGGYQVATAPPTTYQKVRYGVPDDRAVLKRGSAVSAGDGRVGKLEGLLATAGGAITGLVIQHGTLILSRHLVPVELVEAISQSGIFLRATGEHIANLPPYQPQHTQ